MSEKDIWFNYQLAMAQAAALDEIANRLEDISSGELDQGLREAAANWTGENARHYQAKGRQLQEQTGLTARRLHGAADEVRAVARRVREIELANLAIVQNQSS